MALEREREREREVGKIALRDLQNAVQCKPTLMSEILLAKHVDVAKHQYYRRMESSWRGNNDDYLVFNMAVVFPPLSKSTMSLFSAYTTTSLTNSKQSN